jgi:hypothetical protein
MFRIGRHKFNTFFLQVRQNIPLNFIYLVYFVSISADFYFSPLPKSQLTYAPVVYIVPFWSAKRVPFMQANLQAQNSVQQVTKNQGKLMLRVDNKFSILSSSRSIL